VTVGRDPACSIDHRNQRAIDSAIVTVLIHRLLRIDPDAIS
jgi:hypothetical protein